MRAQFHRLAPAALLALGFSWHAHAADSPWRLTRSRHFEVYSQSSDQSARAVLLWFEQLRAFFIGQTSWKAEDAAPVRVIVFGSERDYEPYRLRPAADAYYVGSGSRNTIVMAAAGAREFGLAAHEYAHLILHAGGLSLPPWLNEGLAEFFSTVHVSERATELGGNLPGRVQILRRQPWMPLADLLSLPDNSPLRQQRNTAELFYAESWALAEMLLLSPDYAPRFPGLLADLNAGTPGLEALAKAYGKPVDAVTRDLRAWAARPKPPAILLPGVAPAAAVPEISDVPPLAARLMLADLFLMAGNLDRAEALYQDLAREQPHSADISAALGSIALRRGDTEAARREWKLAIQQGVTDAGLCFNYAVLADQANLPPDDIRPALQRAIALQPEYDDARYQLGLLEKNTGHYQDAVTQLRAMRRISSERAYAYWLALADALNELGRREEAKAAAGQAQAHASTAAERATAAQLAYMAETDLGVRFARDAAGQTQLVTARVPHQAQNWNPFIEAGDDLRSVEGALREIDCSGSVTRLRVETAATVLTLAIPDPTHVQMRNAPPELVCGPQDGRSVLVEYAATKAAGGVLRGLEFR